MCRPLVSLVSIGQNIDSTHLLVKRVLQADRIQVVFILNYKRHQQRIEQGAF
jgi:hypothetical protein